MEDDEDTQNVEKGFVRGMIDEADNWVSDRLPSSKESAAASTAGTEKTVSGSVSSGRIDPSTLFWSAQDLILVVDVSVSVLLARTRFTWVDISSVRRLFIAHAGRTTEI